MYDCGYLKCCCFSFPLIWELLMKRRGVMSPVWGDEREGCRGAGFHLAPRDASAHRVTPEPSPGTGTKHPCALSDNTTREPSATTQQRTLSDNATGGPSATTQPENPQRQHNQGTLSDKTTAEPSAITQPENPRRQHNQRTLGDNTTRESSATTQPENPRR